MENKKCPYCSEDILADAKKCKHCNEWLIDANSSSTKVTPRKESNPKINAACWIAIIIEIILFFISLAEFEMLDSSFSITALYNPILSVSIALSIYLLLALREHFIAKKTVFSQYIILSLIYMIGFYIKDILGESYDYSGVIWLMTIYEIIIAVKIIRNFLHTSTFGYIMIANAIITSFTWWLNNQELSSEMYLMMLIVDLIVNIIWLYSIKYYLQSAPKVAIASNAKTRLANNQEAAKPVKNFVKYVSLSLTMVIVILMCIFPQSSTSTTTTTTTSQPKVLDTWKKWVAIKYVDSDIQDQLIGNYVNSQFNVTPSIVLNLSGDYTSDESGDASWGEQKAYYIIAESLLKKYLKDFTFNKSIKENIRDAIERKYVGTWWIDNALTEANYHQTAVEHYRDLILMEGDNKKRTINNIGEICLNINKLFSSYIEKIEITEWYIDEEISGSSYEAYGVIYYVNKTTYVHCTIIEKKDGSSEIRVNNTSNQLLNLYE